MLTETVSVGIPQIASQLGNNSVDLFWLLARSHTMFSPEFTGHRAQILSHDYDHHLECNDCQYQALVACVPLSTKHFSLVLCLLSSIFRAQTVFFFKVQVVQVAVRFWSRSQGHISSPKGLTVPFGKGVVIPRILW